MIGPIVRHPRIVVILEVDCSAEDGPVPRDHFIQAGRLEGDMMQRGFDDRHCWPPKLFPSLTAIVMRFPRPLLVRVLCSSAFGAIVAHGGKFRGWNIRLGQKRTFRGVRATSALPRKADMDQSGCDVRFVPEADSCAAAINASLRQSVI